MIAYYDAVAETMLPHLRGRPADRGISSGTQSFASRPNAGAARRVKTSSDEAPTCYHCSYCTSRPVFHHTAPEGICRTTLSLKFYKIGFREVEVFGQVGV